MRTLERMERAIAIAEQIGLPVRYEYLGGVTGGICEIAGKKWIFVDLALSPDEQLQQVTQAIAAATQLAPISCDLLDSSCERRAA